MADRRRRCALVSCRKQYWYERATSRFCSPRCRKAAQRLRESDRPNGTVNGHYRDYTVLAQKKPVEPEVYDGPSDEEYMRGLEAQMFPNGSQPLPSAPPRATEGADLPREIIIHNVPTRFPGTPPRYGRQLMP